MKKSTTYLLLGSNSGNRSMLLTRALTMISSSIGTIVRKSSVYETAPWGFEAEVPFLNQAIVVETGLSAQRILEGILEIEMEFGRKRVPGGYASRSIDIDILFYGQKIIMTPELTIPHPLIRERRFVLVPLQEIAPDLVHPVYGVNIRGLLASCGDTGTVRKYGE
jgi:2-amino-4-hydroxy-6-hydroxymethyldihydropteridine diphosphokinase